MAASATCTTPVLSLSSPSSYSSSKPRQCSTLPPSTLITTSPVVPINQSRKAARNVAAMATTGEATTTASTTTTTTSEEVGPTIELPEIVNTLQETWEKIEDKYAVSSLAVAGVIGLCAASGMISAIDKLPLVPGVFELVGIGYTGWFAYKNLIFTPQREALIQKVKDTYKDIIGIS